MQACSRSMVSTYTSDSRTEDPTPCPSAKTDGDYRITRKHSTKIPSSQVLNLPNPVHMASCSAYLTTQSLVGRLQVGILPLPLTSCTAARIKLGCEGGHL